MVKHMRGALLLAAASLLACGGDLGPRVPANIVVTPEDPEVLLNGTLQLEATLVDANGREVDGGAITFRSSADTILTVDETGLLTPAGRLGSARIIAGSGDLTGEVEATVVLPQSALVVTPASLELDTGEGAGLTPILTDANGQPVADAGVTFAVGNAQVATVAVSEGVGLVHALAVGTTIVTASAGGMTTEVPVTVTRVATMLTVTPGSLVLPPGTSQQVTAALHDRTGDEMDLLEPFTWTSSNDAVATVSETGMITSVGPEGSAVITASTDTFTATVGVFVGTPPALEMVGRTPIDWAEGVAVTQAGRYYVAGFNTFATGTLPGQTFSAELTVNGDGSDVVLNPTLTRAYVANLQFENGEGVGVVDLTTSTVVDSIPIRLGIPWSLGLSGLGTVLTVGTSDGIELIDLSTNRSLGAKTIGFVNEFVHHPLRPVLYASTGGAVLELDDRTGEILRRFPGEADALAVTRDGLTLYTVTWFGGTLAVWNLDTGLEERRVRSVGGRDLALSPDEKFLYVLFSSNHVVGGSKLYVVDPGSGALVQTLTLGGLAGRLAVAGDGTIIATNQGGEVGWVDFIR